MINAGFSCGMTNPTAAPILRLAHLDPDQHRAAAYMVLLKTMATTQSHGRFSISGLGWSFFGHACRTVRALHAGRIVRAASLGPRLG